MIMNIAFGVTMLIAIGLFYSNMYLSGERERSERQLKRAEKDVEFYKKLAEMWEEKYNDDQPVIIKNL